MSDTNSFRATKIDVVILLKQLRLGLRGVKTNEKANMHNQHWQSLHCPPTCSQDHPYNLLQSFRIFSCISVKLSDQGHFVLNFLRTARVSRPYFSAFHP